MKKVYYLKTCSTCIRILKELNLPSDFILQDIKTEEITANQLEFMKVLAGSYEALFSKRSKLYKEMDLKNQNLEERDYKNYILEHYTFLSRPVIIIDGAIFIGIPKKFWKPRKIRLPILRNNLYSFMKKYLSIILIFFSTTYILAQKAKIKEGSWENLKGITEFNLLFDYSNLEIPNYESEDAFLKDKMQMREERKPGDGERFRKSWFADRENRYEPQFIEYFNTYFKEKSIHADKNVDSATHIMKIHTTFIYPGYNVGVWRHDSKLFTTVTVYERPHENQVLFSADIFGIKGGKESSGFDFNSGDRIAQSYGILARYLAKKIRMASK